MNEDRARATVTPNAETELLPQVPLSRRRSRTGRPFNTTTPLGRAMERRGLRVGDMAALCGVSERVITDYLNGRKIPTEINLIYMARALDVRVDDIRIAT